jgi:hypothetical protein
MVANQTMRRNTDAQNILFKNHDIENQNQI